jgi:hypothetical protein
VLGQALAKLFTATKTIKADSANLEAADTINAMRQIIEAHGVKWGSWPTKPTVEAPAPPGGLFVVAGNHHRLQRAFDGTPWANGRWSTALSRLPGALSSKAINPVRIAGAGKARCCWIPGATLRELTM